MNSGKWPFAANLPAVRVFQALCTKLNLDFGLGSHVAGLLEVRDPDDLRKVNVLWSVYTEREKNAPGHNSQDKG
jgi:hypothetical protein